MPYHVKRGFTLIELLVVVLIIGILAAVAVPQYQFATKKAQFISSLSRLKNMATSAQIYYLANSNYTRDIRKFDLQVTQDCTIPHNASNKMYCPNGVGYDIGGGSYIAMWICRDNTPASQCVANPQKQMLNFGYVISTGKILSPYGCTSYTNVGKRLCKSLGEML